MVLNVGSVTVLLLLLLEVGVVVLVEVEFSGVMRMALTTS